MSPDGSTHGLGRMLVHEPPLPHLNGGQSGGIGFRKPSFPALLRLSHVIGCVLTLCLVLRVEYRILIMMRNGFKGINTLALGVLFVIFMGAAIFLLFRMVSGVIGYSRQGEATPTGAGVNSDEQ